MQNKTKQTKQKRAEPKVKEKKQNKKQKTKQKSKSKMSIVPHQDESKQRRQEHVARTMWRSHRQACTDHVVIAQASMHKNAKKKEKT